MAHESLESGFRCRQCGGQQQFDPATAKVRCQSCERRESIPQSVHEGIQEYDLQSGLQRAGPTGYGLETRRVSCSGCGSIVSFEKTMTATSCSFCGSQQILDMDEHRHLIRPESLVPFAVEQKTISGLFESWVRGLWFRPNRLKKLARINQVRGVYIPYWVFDATVDSAWTAMAGHYYYESETYTEVDGQGRSETKTRSVQKTRWVPASGERRDVYDEVLICASKGLSQDLADSLRTFDTKELRPYDPSYLLGWQAEEYQLDLEGGWATGKRRLEVEQLQRCAGDVPGDTQMGLQASHEFSQERYKHTLLPIWIAAYRFRDKSYQFLVNGQTGEIQGHAPYSWVKIVLTVGFLLGALFLGLVLLQTADLQNGTRY